MGCVDEDGLCHDQGLHAIGGGTEAHFITCLFGFMRGLLTAVYIILGLLIFFAPIPPSPG
jgi:hypothetical protein